MSTLVAQTLRQARQERRVTVQAAAHALDLPADALLALEQGDVRALGTKPRAKAIVRAYARWLDIDAERLLLRIDDTWDLEQPEVEPVSPEEADPTPLAAEPPEPAWTPAEPAWEPPAAAWEAETELLAPAEPPAFDLPRPPGGNSRVRSAPPATVPRRLARRRRARRRRLLIALLALLVGTLLARLDLLPAGGDESDLVSLDDGAARARVPAGATAAPRTPASATVAATSAPQDHERIPDEGDILAAEPEPADTSVQVLNASGDPEVLSDAVAVLRRLGYRIRSTSPARQLYDVTTVYYSTGKRAKAARLVALDPRFNQAQPNDRGLDETIDLHVVVGQDWRPAPAP